MATVLIVDDSRTSRRILRGVLERDGFEVLDEAALEARVAQAEASEDSNFNPPWYKKLLALTTEKGREREGKFLGEGVHVVQELVSNPLCRHHR